jgi:hypothetical protein
VRATPTSGVIACLKRGVFRIAVVVSIMITLLDLGYGGVTGR